MSGGTGGRVPHGVNVNFGLDVDPTEPHHRALYAVIKPSAAMDESGGEGGIRTHGTREGSTVFETAPFDHSGTSPRFGVVSGGFREVGVEAQEGMNENLVRDQRKARR